MTASMDPERYLEYGGVAPSRSLDPAAALSYLMAKGFGGNYLERSRLAVAEHAGAEADPGPESGAHCDFCGRLLRGGEFDLLQDGRLRCITCSKTVVSTHDEFVALYQEVKRNLEVVFEIQFRVGMTVRMENAKTIARRTTEPSSSAPGFDGRVLGFASESATGYDLHVENGSPKLATISTLAHELTHVWQYRSWDARAIRARYGDQNSLFLYEGMASWVMVQYMYCTRETDFARRSAEQTRAREDEYGAGFRLFEERYPLRTDGRVIKDSPFRHPLPL